MRVAVTFLRAFACVALVGTFGATSRPMTPARPQLIGSCSLTQTALAFGNYNPVAGGSLPFSGSMNLTCGIAANVSIALGAGSSGSFTPRSMPTGKSPLTYNLFTDSADTTIWGDGTNGTSTKNVGNLIGSTTIPIYGAVPGGQVVPAGTYGDSIQATIDFF